MFSFTYDSLSFSVFLRWRLLVLTVIISVPEVSYLASCVWNPMLGTKSTHRVCKWQPSCPLFHVLCFSWAFHQEMRQNQQWGLPPPSPICLDITMFVHDLDSTHSHPHFCISLSIHWYQS